MKIRVLSLCLMLLLAGCNKKSITNNGDFFLVYDDLQIDNKTKERILDSLYLTFKEKHKDSTTRQLLFKFASRYERLGLETKFYNTVNKVQLWAIEEKDTSDIARSL